MHTVFLSPPAFLTFSPAQFKYSVFQIINVQEKSMWLSSKQKNGKVPILQTITCVVLD